MSRRDKDPVSITALINTSLKYLNYGGYNPKHRTIFKLSLAYTIWILIIIYNILQGVFILVVEHKDMGSILVDVIVYFGYWQLVSKLHTLLSKHKLLDELIEISTKKFWGTNAISEENREEVQNVYELTGKSVHLYHVLIFITMCGHYATSIMRSKTSLIMNVWLPPRLKEVVDIYPGHEIFLLFEMIVMTMATLKMVENDSAFIIFIGSVIGELKILKICLNTINAEMHVKNIRKSLIKLIEHHILIFHFLTTIERMYNKQMLIVLASNMILAVISSFSALFEENIAQLFTYVVMFMAVASQIFLSCFLGQLIQDETASVAGAAYHIEWENIPDRKSRVLLMMIIMRSQKHFSLSMGGFFIMCLETFTRIARLLLSSLTFMLNFSSEPV